VRGVLVLADGRVIEAHPDDRFFTLSLCPVKQVFHDEGSHSTGIGSLEPLPIQGRQSLGAFTDDDGFTGAQQMLPLRFRQGQSQHHHKTDQNG